ncbi:PucR family transcriptional regulator [Paenibacillus antri]|uniref:PucR family transcriptional regulator n=1 Tax=Paenibacillus antri TaxID=2582848 RepID=A0A5R9GHS2_9BACL|nr:PucR family transcriptional regulator [Paenibacillus antri]TLS54036.1 PucR family transcriptional regulator [Paenibacillus antri]
MELRELLRLTTLKDATVLAGSRGIDRKVSSVNIMDAPDIVDFVKPEQLLLTNAYAIKDTPSALVRIIERMAAGRGAGIFIKTKRFLRELPEDVLLRANELDFPIVELHMQYSLGEVLHQTLGFILEKQTEHFRYALDMHKQFSEMMMKGRGLPQLVEALASILDCHVLITDERNDAMIVSKSLKTVRHEPVVRRIAEMVRRHSSEASLAPGASCLWGESPYQPFEVSFHPIETFSRQCFLVFIRSEQTGSPEGPFRQLAVEQAANVIEFEWMKRHAVKERSRRFKFEFFSDLVEGLIQSEEEIYHRGRTYYDFEPHPHCLIAAMTDGRSRDGITASSPEEAIPFATKELIYDRIKLHMEQSAIPYVRFMKNDLFCILLNAKNLPFPAAAIDVARRLQHELHARHGLSISFGIGTPVESFISLSVSYKEALEALKAGTEKRKPRFVETYTAKQTEDLLRFLPLDVIKNYYSTTFNRLLDVDDKEKTELQKTVRTFLEHQGSISDTSKKLFIHRNTVVYRLQKYERLTQRSLLDPNDTLRIRLALIMEKLLENAPSETEAPKD